MPPIAEVQVIGRTRTRLRNVALWLNTTFVAIWLPAVFSSQLHSIWPWKSTLSSSGEWIFLSVLLFGILVIPVLGYNLFYFIYWLRNRKQQEFLKFNQLSSVVLILVPVITTVFLILWAILSVLLVASFNHTATQGA